MSLKKLPELCRDASGGKLGALRNLLRFLRKEKVRPYVHALRERQGREESLVIQNTYTYKDKDKQGRNDIPHQRKVAFAFRLYLLPCCGCCACTTPITYLRLDYR